MRFQASCTSPGFGVAGGILLVLVGLPLAPAQAEAQSIMSRPYRGIFGERQYGSPAETLDATLTVVEAYDDNLLAESGGVNPSTPAIGGFYTMLGADGAYEWRGRRTQFGATAGTVLRYYHDSNEFVPSGAAGIGFSTVFARRTNLSVNQTFAYSPSYLTGLFPSVTPPSAGDAPPIGASYAVDDTSSYSYGTRLSISWGVTRRGTLTASADYQFVDYVEEMESRTDQSTVRARVEFSRGMTRNTSLRVAYRFANGDLGTPLLGIAAGDKTREHGFDVGMDYTKPLSPTRRLVFGFGIGSSAVDLPVYGVTPPVSAFGDEQQYRALADASLAYQFNRTWETRASYHRGLDYIPELAEPVYSDGVSWTLTGLLTQRMDFTAGVGFSTGEPVSFRSANAFDTYTANARIRHSVSRTMALYLEYVYYYYDFSAAQVQPGVPPQMERNGVRAGLTFWLPVRRR